MYYIKARPGATFTTEALQYIWVGEALLHRSMNERIPVFDAVLCGCCHATNGFRACACQHAIKDCAADGDFRLLETGRSPKPD
jgi:hypothetical protein